MGKTTRVWKRRRKKERKRKKAKERINKIKRIKEEAEDNKDQLLAGEKKFYNLLTDLQYERQETLYNIAILESKLIESKISPEQTDRIKHLVLLS